ncbi:MAG: TonB-dependent receptor [Elusimicrobia bacterium]|nr:TonB-dependent receptor [Candidatus Liberimonas magnetica]
MKIINKVVSFLFVIFLAVSGLFAENGGVFLSLTRKAQSMKDLPTNTSVITETQIKNMNEGTLGDVIRHEVGLNPSLTGTFGAESNLMIRGAASPQVLVLIDGRKVNALSSGIADLSTVPLDNIERIEIIRGAASAIYGANAIGGVINIITKKPKDPEPVVAIGLSYGSFSTQSQSINIGTKKENTSFMITGSRNLSDGWRDNSGYDSKDMFLDLGYNTVNFGNFDFSGTYFTSSLGTPGLGVSLDKYDGNIELLATTPEAKQTEEKKNVSLKNEKKLGENLIKTTLYFSNERINFKDPLNLDWTTGAVSPIDTDYKSTIYNGEVQVNTLYNITAGFEWSLERYQQSNLMTNLDEISNSRVNSAVYAQDKINAGSLTILPGLRFDSNSSFGSILSPKVTLVYAINEALKVSANSGRAWRSPTFNDLYYPISGNINLKPEDGISSDIGIEYNKTTTMAGVTVFLTETKDLIEWAPSASNPNIWMPSNVSTSRQSGAEFVLKYKIFTGFFHKLNYTYLWALDTTQNTVLFYRPCNTVNSAFTYLFPSNLKFELDTKYVSSQETNSVPTQLPAYTLYDFGLTKEFGPDAQLWAKVKNATDEKYQTRLGYPVPGRTVFVGIKIKFVD